MKNKWTNMLLLLGVVVLAVVPFLIVSQKEGEEIFAGADVQAEALITKIRPEYKPWFSNLWEPPSGEVETFMFALQAAIGAGVFGYYFGLKRGQLTASKREETHAAH